MSINGLETEIGVRDVPRFRAVQFFSPDAQGMTWGIPPAMLALVTGTETTDDIDNLAEKHIEL
jgi:hypothetical protein